MLAQLETHWIETASSYSAPPFYRWLINYGRVFSKLEVRLPFSEFDRVNYAFDAL